MVWALELAGATVGWQAQTLQPPLLRIERAWRFTVDGRTVSPHAEVRAALRDDGSVVRVERRADDGRQSWTPATPAWLADHPAIGPDVVPILDARTGEVALEAAVADAAGHTIGARRWSGGGWTLGALVARPVDAVPTLGDHDLLALVHVPTAPQPDARRSHHAVLTIDGARHTIDVPLAAEIPRATTAAVRAVLARVAADLDDAPTPGEVPATAALAAGTGDCTEHREVFLARAALAGLAARPAEGLVYVHTPSPGFLPHAWAEVRVGDAWVPVDPTWGQWPADATHVPLALADRLAAITRAGQRSITVTEIR